MDPVEAVIALLAHGGWVGLAVELAGALAIVALGLAFWVGNRRDSAGDDE